MRKVTFMNYGSSTSRWKPWKWVRVDLILTTRDIYINLNLSPLTKFTSSSRDTEFKDILPWNISQIITKAIPISTRIAMSYAMKRGIWLWVYWKVNGNRDQHDQNFPMEGEPEQMLASEEINKPKRAGLWESHTEIRVTKLTIWVRSFEMEKL